MKFCYKCYAFWNCFRTNIVFFFAVNTIAVAKPEKARMVESMLIQMAQTGQIQARVIILIC